MKADLLEGYTREQATFCKTKSSSCSNETGKVVHNTQQGSANCPDDHDERDPDRRGQLLQHQVRRNLCKDVCWEKRCDSDLVVVSSYSDRGFGRET